MNLGSNDRGNAEGADSGILVDASAKPTTIESLDPSECPDRRPHCGPCDYGLWSVCTRSGWSCPEDAGTPDFSFQFGCECHALKFSQGIYCCDPDAGTDSDAGPIGQADCDVSKVPHGSTYPSSGTLVCEAGVLCGPEAGVGGL